MGARIIPVGKDSIHRTSKACRLSARNMTLEFQSDVFLSHNAKNTPRVRRLAEQLKQARLRVWFDEWSVRPGDIIALKVNEGLEQSRGRLLCISPNARASSWVLEQRTVGPEKAQTGRRKP
jgi:hypothetical protein